MTGPIRPLAGNELDELLVEQQNDERQQLQQSLTVARKRPVTPQQMAKALPIAKQRALPSDVVARHLDELERGGAGAQGSDYESIIRDTPGLAEWLRDPDNATLSRDELPALSRIERGARTVAPERDTRASLIAGVRAAMRGAPGVPGGAAELLAPAVAPALATGMSDLEAATGHLAVAYGLAQDPAQAAQVIARANKTAAMLRDNAPRAELDYRAATQQIGADYAAGKISTPAMLLDHLVAAARHPLGVGYRAIEALAGSGPALAGGMTGAPVGAAIGSAVPGVGTVAGGAIGLGAGTFLGSAPVIVGQEINAELEKRGIDITDAAALEAAFRDPTLMAGIRAKAERKGVTNAAVQALFASFGGALTGRAAGAGAGLVGRTAAKVGDVAVQATGQGLADAAGQLAGDGKVDLSQSMQAAVAMLGQEIGTTAAGASLRARHHADPIVGLHETVARASDALRAQRGAQALSEIGAAIQEATTTASVPDRVKQLVEMASGGEDAAQVFFQSGEWDEYWTAKGASPAKAAADIMGDGGRAYDDARTTGAPLAIALGDYVAKVATTEHFDGLLNAARTTPDGMSLGEAQEYLQSLPSTMRELAAEAGGAKAPELSGADASARAVRDDVQAQLEAAGTQTMVAKAQASLYEAAFRTLGERAGIDPKALYDRYELTIGKGDEVSGTTSAQAIAAQAAYEQAVVNPIDRTASPEQKAAALRQLSEENVPRVEALIKEIDETLGTRSKWSHKKLENIVAKAARPSIKAQKPWFDVEHVRDALRFKSKVDSPAQIVGALEILKKHGVEIVKVDTDKLLAPKEWGWRFAAFDLRMPNGQLVEYYLPLRELDAAGVKDVNHHLFEKWRAKDTSKLTPAEFGEYTDDVQASRDRYEAAFDRALERLKTTREEFAAQWDAATPTIQALAEAGSGDKAAVPSAMSAEASGSATGDQSSLSSSAEGQPVSAASPPIQEPDTRRIGSGLDQTSTSPVRSWRETIGDLFGITHTSKRKILLPETFEQRRSAAGARGRIRFGADGKVAIDLFKAADRSTFLHETGHFYMRVLEDLATAKDAPAELVADHQVVRSWLGAAEGKPLSREQQEQFARGFEAYLMEGKAPSPDLRTVFYRFKQWLVKIYENARNLKVGVSPEVREVFDRLLASRDEIEAAQAAQHATPLFDDPRAVGMSDEDATNYQAAVNEARQSAEESMTAELMKDLRRQDSAEWNRLRVPIEQEVAAQVASDKVYRAMTELTASFKIDREAARELLGDASAQLPEKFTAGDGVPPDVAADMLGFKSARELLITLAHAPSEKAMVKLLTDERMRAEYGEQTTDAEIREHATAAVLGEKRAQLLRREIQTLASENFAAFKGLAKKITAPLPSDAAVKAEAGRIVGSTRVKEITPHLYELAASKHARQAREAFLRGDIEGALALKQKELLVTEIHRAAVDAKASVQDALDGFKAVFKNDVTLAKTRDMDLVNAARSVLATFGIGRSEKPAAAYLEQMRRYEPDTYEFLAPLVEQATSSAKPGESYRTLTFDDFQALKESVESLWTLSRRTRQIEIDGRLLERDDVHAELVTRLADFSTPGTRAGYAKAATTWDKAKMSLMGVRAALRRVESWADAMDEGKHDGVFRRYVWNPVSEGATAYRLAKRDAMAKYLEVVKAVEGSLTKEPIDAPELGYEFANKGELLGALLHAGNESNLSKLLRGRGWGSVDENGVLDRTRWDAMTGRLQQEGVLTKADYDYVQGVWDLFDDLKVGAQRAHKAMYGHYFSEVTANAVTTPFGQYRGGYVPAKADPFMTPDAAIRDERSVLEGNNNSFSFPTTGRGFTKARVDAYAAPLIIDARFVPGHIDGVLRFTHIEPRVKDVARVLHDRDVTGAMDAVDPTIRGDMLVPWLQRAATQKVDVPSGTGWGAKAMDLGARELRRRSGMQMIALNVVNSLQQLTGVSISAVKVGPRHLTSALWQYVRQPSETAAAIADKSEYMRSRDTGNVAEIQKTIDELMLDPSTYDQARDFAAKHGHFLTAATQSVVDAVTWTGAYDEAVAAGHTEKEAVRVADSAVRETQGSGAPEDISRFETGTPFHRLFSMFTGYFNMQANLLGTEFAKTARGMGLRKGAGRLVYVYALGFMIPAVLSDQLMQLGSGRDFDQDDDGPADDALALFFGSQFSAGMRMVPVVGPAVDFATRQFITHRPDDRITTSAAIATIERAAKAPNDVYQAIRDRQLTTKGIRDMLTALGLLTGMPIAPVAKPLGYLNDVSTGRAQPTGPIDFGRGLLTGQPGGSR